MKEEFDEVCTDEAMRSRAKFYNLAAWDHAEERECGCWECCVYRDGEDNEAEDGDEDSVEVED